MILSCPHCTIFTISVNFAGHSLKDGVTDKLNNKQDEVVIYSSVGAAVSVILIVAIVFAILLCKRRGTCRYGLFRAIIIYHHDEYVHKDSRFNITAILWGLVI